MKISHLIPPQTLDNPRIRSSGGASDSSIWEGLISQVVPENSLEETHVKRVEATALEKQEPSLAESKLTELLLSQTLRSILPKQENQENTTAAETWRGMLADIVAEKVASAMPAVAKLGSSSQALTEQR